MPSQSHRRSFLQALLAVPFIGLARFAQPTMPILYGDGVHDDTEALQAMFRGDPVRWRYGDIVRSAADSLNLPAGTYRITLPLQA